MKSEEILALFRRFESITVAGRCVSDHFADASKMVTNECVSNRFANVSKTIEITSFSPNSNNKTTLVEGKLSHIFNLITSFFKNGLLKLGNEVFIIFPFIRATEVVLLVKLGGNEVILFSPDNQKLKIKN